MYGRSSIETPASGNPMALQQPDLRGDEDVEQLREKIEEMQLLNEALIASVREKHHFLTAMSHRLRTPLTTIVGFGEMLAAGEVVDDADRQMVYGDIVAAGQQMLDLINDMIELARLDAGDLRLHRTQVDLGALLHAVRAQLEPLAEARRQRLVVDVRGDGLTAYGDARWLTQAIVKLGLNAHRFSPTGGTITLRAAETDEGHVEIEVSDTGVGIRPEDYDKVFRAFTGDADVPDRSSGTGLELALVKRLVELQGGTIEFSSIRGLGTTFVVTMPKWPQEPAALPGARAEAASR